MKGIDVSYHNGMVDWDAVRSAGMEFAIVRVGFGLGFEDDLFQFNVAQAHRAGLICGAYHYSYALSVDRIIAEAQACRNIIARAGVLLELPVFLDMEDADNFKARNGFKFNRRNITSLCRAWCDNIGLNTGIYASFSWLDAWIDWRSLNVPIWNAQWGSRDDLKAFMWQFSDSFWIDQYKLEA